MYIINDVVYTVYDHILKNKTDCRKTLPLYLHLSRKFMRRNNHRIKKC